MPTLAKRSRPCSVCGHPLVPGRDPIFNWSGTGDERDLYKKVWVHPRCEARLRQGYRPRAVRRFGPTPLQLMDIVKLCENQLGWTAWPSDSVPATAKERLSARRRWVDKLEALTEAHADRWDAQPAPKDDLLVSAANLRLTVEYYVRIKWKLRDPMQLIEELRDLKRRGRLHYLDPPRKELDHDRDLL